MLKIEGVRSNCEAHNVNLETIPALQSFTDHRLVTVALDSEEYFVVIALFNCGWGLGFPKDSTTPLRCIDPTAWKLRIRGYRERIEHYTQLLANLESALRRMP